KVQLIDASALWIPMRKSLGDKRREVPRENAEVILGLLNRFEEGQRVKIYPNTHFGYRKITVERPLRLNFQATPERIARIEEESAFKNLAISKKKDAGKEKDESEGREIQELIRKFLKSLPETLFKDRKVFEASLDERLQHGGLKIQGALKKAILNALSERDESAEICRDKDGNPEPDPDLRDTETVPRSESIESFFDREVKPHVPDAWIHNSLRDNKDGAVGIVGYEINFNRYFYKYVPARPLDEIEADIKAIEKDIVKMLSEITGSKPAEIIE
ncbi:SAM-dependent DNA methyltransferase, partial [bacterium]|nr:SAM-dependent DNA methyltransferase [bacterium]